MKYERLTDKNWRRRAYQFDDIYNRLAELEDKIESGQAVILRCKVGDKVYQVVTDEGWKEYVVDWWNNTSVLPNFENSICYRATGEVEWNKLFFNELDINKTVFLTKEEAEAKLKELRGG